MSDVIRNAIIKLAIQLQSPDLKVPGIEAAIQQQHELDAAITKNNAAMAGASKAVDRLKTDTESLTEAAKAAAMAEATARGSIASEAIAAESAAVANTTLAGGLAAVQMSLAPIAGGIGAVLLAVNFLGEAYAHLTSATESAADAQARLNELEKQGTETINRISSLQVERAKLMGPKEGEAELWKAFDSKVADLEYKRQSAVPAGKELLKIQADKAKAIEAERKSKIDAIRDGEKELNQAKERLKIAQFAIAREKAGAQDRADRQAAREEQRHKGQRVTPEETTHLMDLMHQQRQAALKSAQEELERRQSSFDKLVGGKSTDDAIRAVNRMEDELAKSVDQVTETLKEKLGKMYGMMIKLENEQADQRRAANYPRGLR